MRQPKKDEYVKVDLNGKPTGAPVGVKNDNGKVMGQLLGDFSRALTGVAEVGTFGAHKYTRGGWQHVLDAEQRYYDALWRHLLQANQEEVDSESGLSHLEHAAWNILAVIELKKRATNAPH